MIKELEINNKVYKLVANREISNLLEKCVSVDKDGNAKVEMPEKDKIFYALLKTEQKDITFENAKEILAYADQEYGIGQMNQAIEFMFNSVFTQGSSEKKISWLEEEPKEKVN